MKKVMIVGGTWDNTEHGKQSHLIMKLYEVMKRYILANFTIYNGGNYEHLKEVLENTVNYDYVFWFANVINNNLEKLRDVKSYNPKCMLITSKRNDNNKYDFEELIQRALQQKANLCFEFSKVNDIFNIRIFDPLGCVWYDGTDIVDAVYACADRLEFISSITRKPSNQIDPNIPKIKWSENDLRFLDYVRKSGETFHKLMCLPPDVKRFVGNASLKFKTPTRCMNGFPAIKKDNVILMSKRNVNKEGITEKDFVPCYLDQNKNIEYFGENKPSVDTPVQLRLFEALPEIKYILHGHCYIEDVPFTEKPIPCGAIEEVDEILNFIRKHYSARNLDQYLINLKGHGCLILANESTLDVFDKIKFTARKIPELI